MEDEDFTCVNVIDGMHRLSALVNAVAKLKKDKKEIKKREKILSMVVDEEVEVEIEMYKEEIEKFTNELKTRKQLVKNYKKL